MAQESFGARLHRGEKSYAIVGLRRRWYVASGVLVAVSLLSMLVRGLNLGIDFKGGVVFTPPANGHSVSDARSCVSGVGGGDPVVQEVRDTSGRRQLRIQTGALGQTEVPRIEDALTRCLGVSRADLNPQEVGASWGKDISRKALVALLVFLVAVTVFLSVYFEFRLAVAALVALFHDLVITAGVYSILGFVVTPATVIGLLTILGYSLYDTVVVFDKVRENTAGLAGRATATYSQAANLAVNQTLVRSINTSVIALLPVVGLLVVGAGLLGAGTLAELALALLVGIASGAYSSIFIATPLAADLKEREPQYRALARRVAARQAGTAPAPAARTAVAGGTEDGGGAAVLTVEHDEDAAPGRPPTAQAATRPAGRPPVRRGGRPGGRGGRPGGRKRR